MCACVILCIYSRFVCIDNYENHDAVEKNKLYRAERDVLHNIFPWDFQTVEVHTDSVLLCLTKEQKQSIYWLMNSLNFIAETMARL